MNKNVIKYVSIVVLVQLSIPFISVELAMQWHYFENWLYFDHNIKMTEDKYLWLPEKIGDFIFEGLWLFKISMLGHAALFFYIIYKNVIKFILSKTKTFYYDNTKINKIIRPKKWIFWERITFWSFIYYYPLMMTASKLLSLD